ncbi:MAG: dihydrolipoyl dehydrogenase family protein [Luteolibacter sp.]
MLETYDLIVLGGGRAANLAIPAAKSGMKTLLIERDLLGGVCPNRGCVPSKLLIGFAEAARNVREASRHFMDAEIHQIDVRRMFESVNAYVGQVDGRYQDRVDGAGVELVRGEGRFTDMKTLAAAGREFTAGRIVVATGSRPTPPPFAHLPVWTSDHLFPLEGDVPKSLLVIGGGFIGCEMAAFFSAIGTETQLFTRGDKLLGREDHDIERVFRTEFEKDVPTHSHSQLKDLLWDGAEFTATFEIHGEMKIFTAERVLFAIGRIPNTDVLDLGKTGLTTDKRGFLPVNDHLETSVAGIFATGDVNGRFMLQHAAAFEVHYLRQKFLKNSTDPIDERLIAHAVFSHPEVASIGFTEEQLETAGTPYVSVFEDWLASARAEAMRIDYPRIKLLVSPADYAILGCHLVGPESSTLLHQVMMLMHLKNDVRELANLIYIHPALNECLLAAAVKAVGEVRKFQAKN